VVGSLDYKIITADRADDLYRWAEAERLHLRGDEKSLDVLIQKHWIFTVNEDRPKQMKASRGWQLPGEVTPTRFTFPSEQLIYPLRITQISVQKQTECAVLRAGAVQGRPARQLSYQVHLGADVVRRSLRAAGEDDPQEKQWMQVAAAADRRPEPGQRRIQPGISELASARLEWAKKSRSGIWTC